MRNEKKSSADLDSVPTINLSTSPTTRDPGKASQTAKSQFIYTCEIFSHKIIVVNHKYYNIHLNINIKFSYNLKIHTKVDGKEKLSSHPSILNVRYNFTIPHTTARPKSTSR